MGISLNVFKILEIDENKFKKEEVFSPLQTTYADFNFSDEVSSATSSLRFLSQDDKNNRVTYNAVHYSDTINHPVRVFLDDIEEYLSLDAASEPIVKTKPPQNQRTKVINNGYQEVYKFDVIIDFKTSEIFIFTKKSIARSFMRRFKEYSNFNYEYIYFDLTKIDELPELDNVWGIWENSSGRCKKKAYFGTEIHKEEGIKKTNITSYNVEYEYDGNAVDLFIGIECRISSKSSILTNADLFKIYQHLKKGLDVKK